jgi:hypothetical protein
MIIPPIHDDRIVKSYFGSPLVCPYVPERLPKTFDNIVMINQFRLDASLSGIHYGSLSIGQTKNNLPVRAKAQPTCWR